MLEKKYKNILSVKIVNAAIGDKNSNEQFLYHAPNEDGHSIFKSKINVYSNIDPNTDKKEMVKTIIFSDWIKSNVLDFDSCINVLKFNIEGAEWFLFKDMISNNILKKFNIICGELWDVKKVIELVVVLDEYSKLINDNNISVHGFSGQGGGVGRRRCGASDDILWMKTSILDVIKSK